VGHVLVVRVCLAGESDARQGLVGNVSESVAAAFEGVKVGVVDVRCDHCGGDGLVAEHVAPAGEGQVAGQDQGGVLVAAGDELEGQFSGVFFER
jgi:hypothetical protein